MTAGQLMGMNLAPKAPYIRSLTQLRGRQRPDKGKSGKKKPRLGDIRTFSLLPVHDVNTEEELEEIQVSVASSLEPTNTHSISYSALGMEEAIESAIRRGIREVEELSSHCQTEDEDDSLPDIPYSPVTR